jgi:hypothetical protein
MKTWKYAGALAPLLLAASAAGQAQAPAAVPATGCELHVWPAERMAAMTTGWGVAFGAIGGAIEAANHVDQNRADQEKLARALDSQGQAEALRRLDLPALLKLPPARVVIHPDPLDPKTLDRVRTRRAESTSPCYDELIVGSLLYQKAAMHGRSLKALFIYRHFGAAPKFAKTYRAWSGNGLKIFPPEDPSQVEAAAQELVDTFAKDVKEFAEIAELNDGLAVKAKRR